MISRLINGVMLTASASVLAAVLWLGHENTRLAVENADLRQELEHAARAAESARREALALRRAAQADIDRTQEEAHAALERLEAHGVDGTDDPDDPDAPGGGDNRLLDGMRGVLGQVRGRSPAPAAGGADGPVPAPR